MVDKKYFKQIKSLVPQGGTVRLYDWSTHGAKSYWITNQSQGWRTIALNGSSEWYRESLKGHRWFK